ncbi:MAG: phosphoglucosamine mutase [Ruminococcus sp.]|nr:phosphoglucosamine mutase [Ruminococcus sp.]
MGRLFGTDGARGVAITELTCELAMKIGRAAAVVLTRHSKRDKAKIIIGKDTRISSDVLESALVAGICSVGADAVLLGVIPTPAVAVLVEKYDADAGFMISASHNSVEFNGIKLFSSEGFKLPDSVENEIEKLILDTPDEITLKEGIAIGRIIHEKNAVWDYLRHIMKSVDCDFRGIKVAVDCANGAASDCATKLFQGLGASCYFINNDPDGTNINRDCGSTHLEQLRKYVVDNRCHVGLAFDGDADRCLAVDEKGEVVDGDKLLAIFSKYMKACGTLNSNTCVVTVMTNLGFMKYAKKENVVVARTGVGDRYVLEEMQRGGYNLGGEQSGHIIMLDYANTGDGEMTGVKLLEIMVKTKKKLSELASVMETYPQVLENVTIKSEYKGNWQTDKGVAEFIEMYKEKLGDDGRILVRESGTEPLVRVMLEGKHLGKITEYAKTIAEAISKSFGV